jgi:hypothetical protein
MLIEQTACPGFLPGIFPQFLSGLLVNFQRLIQSANQIFTLDSYLQNGPTQFVWL